MNQITDCQVMKYLHPELGGHVDNEDKADGVTIRDSIGREQKSILNNESLLSLGKRGVLPSMEQEVSHA